MFGDDVHMPLGVQRALIILKYIAGVAEGIGVRDLARALGYSPSTVQKSLEALASQGFVQQDPDTKRYTLGPAAVQVGLTGLARFEVRQVARPHLEFLAAGAGETAMLGVRYGDVAVYVDKALASAEMRVDVPIGARRPFNCTAIGKVLLAAMTDAEFDRLAQSGAFEQATPHSVTETGALRHELARVREQGYAIDREEFAPGSMCIAAPVRNHDGNVVAAVTVAGPTQRVAIALNTLVQKVTESAKRTSAALGYQG